MNEFVHLRVHSAYSLAEGAVKIKDLIKLCVKHAMPAVAVTDTHNLFGALEFAEEAAKSGVQPIIGTLLGIAAPKHGPMPATVPPADELLLLAQNETGYLNLLWLVSEAYTQTAGQGEPQLPLAALAGHSEGLICLSGSRKSALGRSLLQGQTEQAELELAELQKLFHGRLYLELQRHGQGQIGRDETTLESKILALADKFALPLVATNDVFFATPDIFTAHDALLCIAEGRYVTETDRRRVTPEHYFKTAREMQQLFVDIPEAVVNTSIIAQRCAYMPRKVKPLLPKYADDEQATLRQLAKQGLAERLKHIASDPAPYEQRLDYELNLICQMGFAGYFLITADFIRWAKMHNIPVGPGRGSGAGSAVAWALTITDLDPLRLGLLFERFLNPERVSMPDFDIDFCQDRRDEVIAYVQQKYGHERVAQIITFGKLQARAVLRDVGRVLQLPYGQVDKICKLVPNNPANPLTLQEALDTEPQLAEARDGDPTVARMIDIALKLEGLYRHASTHAAGVVIADRPLTQLIPIYRDPRSSMPVTQFNMKVVENAGLVKFDFLGLKTLSVLQEAVKLVQRHRGQQIDLTNLPLDDAPTFAMLARGDTTGVFQLESSGMRDICRKMRMSRFEEIIALVALYRPGPMDNIPRYINTKLAVEPADYLHPLFEPILTETYGVPVYQEQVMQMAQVMAGYSLGGADLLRRAMGKKIKEEMDAQRKVFTDGAAAQHVPAQQASHIFDQIEKFAGYGFNKSHAAAYALVAYQTAYMKANFGEEFLAATMTYESGDTDKLSAFRQELQRLGIPLLPPDINASEPVFVLEHMANGRTALRYALAALKGVGRPAMEALLAERQKNGPFKNVYDLAERLDQRTLNRRQMESLVKAGAFDSLEPNRAKMFEAIDIIIKLASVASEQRQSGQNSLFGAAPPRPKLTEAKPWDELQQLQYEFDAIGFYLTAHPLDGAALLLERLQVVPSTKLAERAKAGGATRVKLAGIVLARQERIAKSGNRFAFVQMSDAYGSYEIMVFSELLASSRSTLEPGRAVLITADIQQNGEDIRLTTQAVELLDKAVEKATQGLRLLLRHQDAVPQLQQHLGAASKGRGRMVLALLVDEQHELEIELTERYAITGLLRQSLKDVPDVLLVQDL